MEEGRLELDEIVFLGSGGRHHEVMLTFFLSSTCHKSDAVLTAMYFILERINYYIMRW